MQIVKTVEALRSARKALMGSVGLVPTMGALHDGHLSLIRQSRQSCTHTVATIFVNPTQFAPTEDLARYPRTYEQDCAQLASEGVDLLFAPSPAEMYPTPTQTWVDVPVIGTRLDGASREGHFRGVATVVAKLFNLVGPHKAYFGQKDAAQVVVLRAMVRDLNFNLELIVCPTVRDPDGLALSSRNRYLNPAQRTAALSLFRGLHRVEQAVQDGERHIPTLQKALSGCLTSEPAVRLDYADLVDADNLEPVQHLNARTLVAVAAWIGDTRLIDNVVLSPVVPR